MHQKPAYELCVFQGNDPSWVSGLFRPGRKGGMSVVYFQDPAVCYCDLIGIAPQIFKSIPKAVKSLFDIRAPVLVIKVVFKLSPLKCVPEFFTGTGEVKVSSFKKIVKAGKKFPFKFIS